MRIRSVEPADEASITEICLATGQAGEPVRGDDDHRSLVAAVYALPYLRLEPTTARVLVSEDEPAHVLGYVVGAVDSGEFVRRWRREWLTDPWVREVSTRTKDSATNETVRLRHLLTQPEDTVPECAEHYPSHLHINLLPGGRGGGWGSRLLGDFLQGLREAGSVGVHLGVDPANTGAIGFYRRIGFVGLGTQPDTVYLGLRL